MSPLFFSVNALKRVLNFGIYFPDQIVSAELRIKQVLSNALKFTKECHLKLIVEK